MECFSERAKEIEGRIDSHFYKPEFKNLEVMLRRLDHRRLSDIVDLSREVWNQKDYYEKQFPYIEINEIDISSGEIKNIIYYDKKDAPSRAKMIVRENDIIVSTTRPHRGAICLIDESKDGFIASTGFAVLRKIKVDGVKRGYLFCVLGTKLSLKQMLQRSSGGNYPAITSEELRKLIIPVPPLEIQNEIVRLMQKAYKTKKQKEAEAQQLLDSINDFVIEQLGIKLPKLEDKMCHAVSYEEVQNERADAYYYQPKFKKLYKSINSYERVFYLKDIVKKLDYGLMPTQDYALSEAEGIPMIRVTNILQDGSIDMSDVKYIPFDTPKLNSKRVKENDILMVQCGNTTGKLAIVPEKYENYTFGSFSFVIRGKRNFVNQYYLFSILSNKLVQEQIKHTWNIVTVRPNTSKPNVQKLLIPLPPLEVQKKIAEEVKRRMQRAETLQLKAKEVIEKAKAEVERIILGQ